MENRKLLSSIILVVFILSIPSIVSSVNAAETKTLNPIADSYVEEYQPDANYGGKEWLEIADSSNMFVLKKEAYLMFNLSDISKDVTIDSAILQVYTALSPTETHSIGAHYCSDNSWAETGITWNNKPSYTTSATSTQTVSKANTWYNWTVTSDVKTALTANKVTFVLKSEDTHETAWVYFDSRDQTYSWMQQYEPKLVVTYTVPTTPTTTTDTTTTAIAGVVLLVIIAGVGFFAYKKLAKKKEPLAKI